MGVVPPWEEHRDGLASCPVSLLALLSPVAAISLACDPIFLGKEAFGLTPICLSAFSV